MRDIRFRAWDKGVEGDKHRQPHMETFTMQDICKGKMNDWWLEEVEHTIMQYTGLKDKNSVEIFEGDIVEWRNRYRNPQPNSPHMGHVKWEEANAGFAIYNKLDDDWADNGDFLGAIIELKVIGNIYENPELLK